MKGNMRKIWTKILGIQKGSFIRLNENFRVTHPEIWVWIDGEHFLIPSKFFIGEVLEVHEGNGEKYFLLRWFADKREERMIGTISYQWFENMVEIV